MSQQANEVLLEVLLSQARHSDCAKLRFGAAVLNDIGGVLSLGYNHNPFAFRRMVREDKHDFSCARDCVGGIRTGVRSGTCVERCYAIHAEQHALLRHRAQVYEVAVAGLLPDGLLFDNGGGFYCTVCARLMVSAGVEYVSIWSKGERVRLTMAEAWKQSYSIATGVGREDDDGFHRDIGG